MSIRIFDWDHLRKIPYGQHIFSADSNKEPKYPPTYLYSSRFHLRKSFFVQENTILAFFWLSSYLSRGRFEIHKRWYMQALLIIILKWNPRKNKDESVSALPLYYFSLFITLKKSDKKVDFRNLEVEVEFKSTWNREIDFQPEIALFFWTLLLWYLQ